MAKDAPLLPVHLLRETARDLRSFLRPSDAGLQSAVKKDGAGSYHTALTLRAFAPRRSESSSAQLTAGSALRRYHSS